MNRQYVRHTKDLVKLTNSSHLDDYQQHDSILSDDCYLTYGMTETIL